MLTQAKEKYGFDLSRSFVIGDKCIDVQTGKSVGALSIQVATGYGAQEKEICTNQRDYYATDLFDAVQYITKKLRHKE